MMLDALIKVPSPDALVASPRLFYALEQAAGTLGRLDQALHGHPLHAAFLYRARLEAVRRQAAVDGHGIDPWHLAATIEGLRLRMDHALRIVDRGDIFAAARTAFELHEWITAPSFDQEGEVQAAERYLAASPVRSALLAAASEMHAWLETDHTRAPMRAALIRFWVKRRVLRLPIPLTAPRALAAEAPADAAEWVCAFLEALAEEARDYQQILFELQSGWLSARVKAKGRRNTSRAAAAIDVLAAAPLISATTLARAIDMSIKCATELLDQFAAEEIVVEVTHRSARRLFGLKGMSPVREVTTAPRRPTPGRGRGRPPLALAAELEEPAPAPVLSVSRFEWPPIDYTALEAAMAHCDQTIRSTKRRLDDLLQAR